MLLQADYVIHVTPADFNRVPFTCLSRTHPSGRQAQPSTLRRPVGALAPCLAAPAFIAFFLLLSLPVGAQLLLGLNNAGGETLVSRCDALHQPHIPATFCVYWYIFGCDA